MSSKWNDLLSELLENIAQSELPKYYFDTLTIASVLTEVKCHVMRLDAWKLMMMLSYQWPFCEYTAQQFYVVNSFYRSMEEMVNEPDACPQSRRLLKKQMKHWSELRDNLHRDASAEYWIHEMEEDSPC